jgi:hypothetical protein
MHPASHDSLSSEPHPASKSRTSSSLNDAAVDRCEEQYSDFDQQYIMLDGGVFLRVTDASKSVGPVQQQTPSTHVPALSASFCQDSHLDPDLATSPRLLIVPQYNMAVNSVSRAFSVGGRSFLVSPTCVDSEHSLLSVLDGNVSLSNDSDGDIMLWCSWFVNFFCINHVLQFFWLLTLLMSQVHAMFPSDQRCAVFCRFWPHRSSLLHLPSSHCTGTFF